MKWKINSLQYVSLMAFPIIGTIIGIGSQILFVNSSIDSYLSIIVEGVLGLFYLKMLFFVLNYRGDLSLFDISREILGKKVGNVCNFVLCLIGVVIATTSLFSIFCISIFKCTHNVFNFKIILSKLWTLINTFYV